MSYNPQKEIDIKPEVTSEKNLKIYNQIEISKRNNPNKDIYIYIYIILNITK